MRSQMERTLSLLYRRERRCLDIMANVGKGRDGKARISPEEAAVELFRDEIPEEQLLCFLLLVSLGNKLVQEVVEDIGRRGDGAISVDEALLILDEELDGLCTRATHETIKAIGNSMRDKKAVKDSC